MSEIFHKSCYTTRTTGYKYRTLSTNTGEKTRRDSKEDTTFDRKFTELQREITSRIGKEVNDTQRARQSIQDKLEKIETKINTMLDVQNTIQSLRQDLRTAENTLVDIMEKVEKIEGFIGVSESCSLKSHKSSIFKSRPILKDLEAICNKEDIEISSPENAILIFL
ncbi:uncharacterized protein LOC123868222 [Maniola jurtina]|uniref:uncharacterized protein LOC123868222 n=1 Tax=Maniola jurtina TaxID=191418 RepID=UPI001E6879E0|nr:uncharacterized protein LOC123868222 [Maniola jurtina]